MRKTRAQKIRTEKRKIIQRIKNDIAELDQQINEVDEEIKNVEDKALKADKREDVASGVLKNFLIATLASVIVLVGSAFTCLISTTNELSKAEDIKTTQRYVEVCKEKTNEYIAEYQEGKISEQQLAEKIQNLDKVDFIVENCSTEELAKVRKFSDDALKFVIGSTAAFGAAAIGVGASQLTRVQAHSKYNKLVYKDKETLDAKKSCLLRKRRQKEYELEINK